jgi:hypothetical protein
VRSVVAAVTLLVAGSAFADEATPDQRAKARELGQAALRKLDDNQDYAGASDLFMKAYETSHEITYLVNVAVTQRKAKLPHQAVATYRRCLAEGGTALAPELRTQLENDILIVTRESAQATVRTEGDPAEILLDDRVVGTASKAAPLLVLIAPDAGRVLTLKARRVGFREAQHRLETLSIGTPAEVELVLAPIPTTGTLKVESVPTGARLTSAQVKDLSTAPVSLELPPGDYTFRASLPGHEDTIQTQHLDAGESRRITLALREIPPSWWDRNKLYVVVAAGTVVAVGAGIGIYYGFKPDYGQRFDYP